MKPLKVSIYFVAFISTIAFFQNCGDSSLVLPEIEIEEPEAPEEEVVIESTLGIGQQPIFLEPVLYGATVQLTVVATSNEQLVEYQWFKDGVEILGANQEFLNLTDVGAEEAGDYFVRVSAGDKILNSEIATVATVNPVTPFVGVAPVAGARNIVQNLNGAVTPGARTGLARMDNSNQINISGINVTACGHYRTADGSMVNGKFNVSYQATRVRIGGDACTTLCDRSPGFNVFTSTDGVSWTSRVNLPAGIASTPNFLDISVDVPTPYSDVLVCRGGAGSANDNIFIQNLSGTKVAL